MSAPCRRSLCSSLAILFLGAAIAGASPGVWDEPEVTLVTFHRGVYKGGSRHYILWSSRGEGVEKAPASIELSRGEGGEWEMVATDLPNSGRYLWTLPKEDGPSFRLRVTLHEEGGRTISVVSSGAFGIDSGAPLVAPYCKKPREETCVLGRSQADIRFTLPPEPGPAQVKRLEVWASTDLGATWRHLADGRPTDRSIPIRLTPGETRVIIVAQDDAGNRNETPTKGSPPQLRLFWKTEEALPGPLFGGIESGMTYKGGQAVTLTWNPPKKYKDVPARIEIERTGVKGWEILRNKLSWKGPLVIHLPALNSSTTRLRLVLEPKEEGIGRLEELLGPFRIETPPAKATIKKVEEGESGKKKELPEDGS